MSRPSQRMASCLTSSYRCHSCSDSRYSRFLLQVQCSHHSMNTGTVSTRSFGILDNSFWKLIYQTTSTCYKTTSHKQNLENECNPRKKASAEMPFKETCLVDAFRSIGIKVPYTGPGPFWAVSDGAKMLEPLGQLGRHWSMLSRLLTQAVQVCLLLPLASGILSLCSGWLRRCFRLGSTCCIAAIISKASGPFLMALVGCKRRADATWALIVTPTSSIPTHMRLSSRSPPCCLTATKRMIYPRPSISVAEPVERNNLRTHLAIAPCLNSQISWTVSFPAPDLWSAPSLSQCQSSCCSQISWKVALLPSKDCVLTI